MLYRLLEIDDLLPLRFQCAMTLANHYYATFRITTVAVNYVKELLRLYNLLGGYPIIQPGLLLTLAVEML